MRIPHTKNTQKKGSQKWQTAARLTQIAQRHTGSLRNGFEGWPEGWGPEGWEGAKGGCFEGWETEPRKSWGPKGGWWWWWGGGGGGRVVVPKFWGSLSLFRRKFRSFLFLWESPRGIVTAVRGRGPPEVRVWASLLSFFASPGGLRFHTPRKTLPRQKNFAATPKKKKRPANLFLAFPRTPKKTDTRQKKSQPDMTTHILH